MTAPNYDPDEEARLLKELAEIRERKRLHQQFLDDWREAEALDNQYNEKKRLENLVINIHEFEIVSDRLYFKLSDKRNDLIQTLQYHKTSRFDYTLGKWNVEVPQWIELEKKLKEMKNVVILYGDDTEKLITEWKEPYHYHIRMDHRGLLIKLGPKANSYLLKSIPGEQYDATKREHRIAFSEAWRLFKLLDEQPNKFYEPDALEFITNQVTFRAQLDIIARRDKPIEEIVLNGFKLFDFQAVTVEYGEAIEEAGGGGLLVGHEMGLGKTPCALGIVERLAEKGKIKKCIIIVPANLIPNWERQIRKFTNQRPYLLYGEKVADYDLAQLLTANHRYWLISYDIASTITKFDEEWVDATDAEGKPTKKLIPAHNRFLWIEALNFGRFDAAIVDEAHYIKNVGSNRSQALRELGLKIPRWYELTGTPILNRPGELWPLMWLVDKEAAGPYETFMKNYTYDGKNARNVDELREVLRPIMIRKTKKEVLPELPPIKRIIREHVLSKKAREQYQKVLDGMWEDVRKWDGSAANTTIITSILAQLMKMKQVCAWDKMDYTTDLATEIFDQSEGDWHKVIIFSQFVNTPDCVYEVHRKLSPECVVVSGNDEINERMKQVDLFQTNPDVHFLSAGLKAAREGMDITAAGAVIFNDLDWTPGNHWQAEGRAYGRMSDLHSIDSYYIISQDTIEVDIWELLGFKEDVFNTVIEGAEASRDVSVAMELIKRLKERM